MKKIVALALCLIMALSLATVAFGAVKEDTLTAADYSMVAADNDAMAAITNIKKVTTDTVTTTTNGVTTVDVYADQYSISTDGTTYTTYTVVDESIGLYKLLDKNGAFICWLVEDAKLPAAHSTLTVSAATEKGTACGAPQFDIYTIKGVDYYAEDMDASRNDTTTYGVAMLNGKLVVYNKTATVNYVKHTFTKADITYSTAGKPTAIKCDVCGKSFEVVKTIPATYTSHNYDATTINGYIILLGNTAGAATTTTGVSSAKTFDAGVALYAGMALMSVAGSAVVIGKKKEF